MWMDIASCRIPTVRKPRIIPWIAITRIHVPSELKPVIARLVRATRIRHKSVHAATDLPQHQDESEYGQRPSTNQHLRHAHQAQAGHRRFDDAGQYGQAEHAQQEHGSVQ